MVANSRLNRPKLETWLMIAAGAGAIGTMSSLSDAAMLILKDQNTNLVMFTQASDGVGGGTLGLNQWIVYPRFSQLAQQWFWFRIGPTGGEQPITSLSDPVVQTANNHTGDPANDFVSLAYTGASLKVTAAIQLTGGTNASGFSDIAETLTLQNLTGTSMSLHFFQYTAMYLTNILADDTTRITGGNTATWTDAGGELGQVTTDTMPSHVEVNTASSVAFTRDSLNDASPTTLNDNAGPVGPDNTTAAFQWDLDIPANGSVTIMVDKQIRPAPEPGSLALLAMAAAGGGLVLPRRARRRR